MNPKPERPSEFISPDSYTGLPSYKHDAKCELQLCISLQTNKLEDLQIAVFHCLGDAEINSARRFLLEFFESLIVV